jgi:DNA-binding MarR family transcriptional regulator
MTERVSEAAVDAWARLLRAHAAAFGQVEGALKRAGLPPLAWYDVLLETERAAPDGLRPKELEARMLLAQYNLSRLLDRMEREGLVERLPCVEDGRGQVVRPTEAGRRLRRRMWPVYAGAVRDAVGAKLTDAEARDLAKLLGKLAAPPRPEEAPVPPARALR